MNLKTYTVSKLKRIASAFIKEQPHKPRISYAQQGEDLIMAFLSENIGLKNPTYIDIGAYHPTQLNNTYYFYRQGSSGINIEPNPKSFKNLVKHRSRDINLNIGINSTPGLMPFFEMDAPTLCTFSEVEAKKYQELGHQLLGLSDIQVDTVENVLQTNGFKNFPDILSLDTEGLEMPILQSLNLQSSGPALMCIETVTYSPNIKDGAKKTELIDYVTSKNYKLIADTFINSIFIRTDTLS